MMIVDPTLNKAAIGDSQSKHRSPDDTVTMSQASDVTTNTG